MFKSYFTKHTNFWNWLRQYQWQVGEITIEKTPERRGIVRFYHRNGDLMAETDYESADVAYASMHKRKPTRPINFTPTQIKGVRYSREAKEQWGWNSARLEW